MAISARMLANFPTKIWNEKKCLQFSSCDEKVICKTQKNVRAATEVKSDLILINALATLSSLPGLYYSIHAPSLPFLILTSSDVIYYIYMSSINIPLRVKCY